MKNLVEELMPKANSMDLMEVGKEKVKSKTKSILRKLWNGFYEFCKRAVDIVAGLCGMICLLPIMLFVKIAYLKDGDKAPIMFKQKRIGKNGKEIEIYKIRSMVVDADKILMEMLALDEKVRQEYAETKKLKNDPRITKVGSFIRKTSLDEFAQFINVFKGDMTLVGPRPYLPREKEDMKKYYKDIINCKPGITGLWQVSGRSDVNFANRCRLDSFYNKHKCLIFDGKIFLKTFAAVLKKEGAV